MRVAILDLGTNTFHLLIAEVSARRTATILFRSRRTVKLGEGAIHKNLVAPVPFLRGIRALAGFAAIIRKYKATRVQAFATSAIRSATNGKDFIQEAGQLGIPIRTISGNEEARLIYLGARQCFPNTERFLLMDIGGGSTEFIVCNRQKIFWKRSFDIGASRLKEMFKISDPMTMQEVVILQSHLRKILQPLKRALEKYPVQQLAGASGSFESFAMMIAAKEGKSTPRGKSYRFDNDAFDRLHRMLLASDARKRMRMKGLVRMRVDTIVLASISAQFVLNAFGIKKMFLSRYALKEGALLDLVKTEDLKNVE